MTRPLVLDGHEVREMTDAELAQAQLDLEEAEERAAELAERQAALESARNKLAALGLTEKEIYALLGI